MSSSSFVPLISTHLLLFLKSLSSTLMLTKTLLTFRLRLCRRLYSPRPTSRLLGLNLILKIWASLRMTRLMVCFWYRLRLCCLSNRLLRSSMLSRWKLIPETFVMACLNPLRHLVAFLRFTLFLKFRLLYRKLTTYTLFLPIRLLLKLSPSTALLCLVASNRRIDFRKWTGVLLSNRSLNNL